MVPGLRRERLTSAARRFRSAVALQGIVVTLVIAVPTLVIEEDWHGRPMIDQPGHLWVIPALVTAVGLLVGGAVSARRSTDVGRAVLIGASIGGVVSMVLVVADVARRTARHQALSHPVVRLWVEAALISVLLAALGAAGSYLATTSQR
jgi:hypothetical protein